ncbi:MAG: alpha/beta fold hydrolase [Clostridia bacterium]|nr:alpha/beta fold hydrolase [Clostridia bacterium]
MGMVLVFCMLSMAATAIVVDRLFARIETASDPAAFSYAFVDASRYPRTSLRFLSGDNELQGYLYEPPDRSADALIVTISGYGGNADSHLPETLYFLDHGFAVFCFDGTGVCKSEGNSRRGLEQSRFDTSAALTYLQTTAWSSLPVLLYGHSAGGYAALALAKTDHVAAIVCIAGFDSPLALMRDAAADYVGPLSAIGYPFLRLQDRLLFGEEADNSAVTMLESATVPVLIVEGTEDMAVKEDNRIGSRIDGTNDRITLWTIDTPYRNGHATAWLSEEAAAYRWQDDPTDETPLDPLKANEIDPDFLARVAEFYRQAL